MKLVLLDENLPHILRRMIPGHDVRTVDYQGWKSLSNGALLKAAEEAGFHAMITVDQGIQYQQNLQGHKIAVVILSSKKRKLVTAHIEQIVAAIDAAQVGNFIFVEIGH